MEGKQNEVYEAIMEMASKVLDGMYGKDNDFDVESWRDDLDDLSYVVESELADQPNQDV